MCALGKEFGLICLGSNVFVSVTCASNHTKWITIYTSWVDVLALWSSFRYSWKLWSTYSINPCLYKSMNSFVLSHCDKFFIIIIRQLLCPVVGRRPQHVVSKLPCLVLSSTISCRSSICPGRLSTAWLVSLVVFSCHMVSKWWRARSIGRLWGGWYMPCPGPFHFSHRVDYIYEFCPLPNPDVGPSIFVCDVEHTSFHFQFSILIINKVMPEIWFWFV